MILYFTGTGNSEYVAKRIGAMLEDDVLNLFDKLKAHDYSPMVSDKPWVIVTPTYAWQIPNIVKNWLNQTVLNGNKEMYFVLTCGDSIGNAADFAKEYCELNNKKFKGLTKVDMPENYIAMFNAPEETEAREIVRKADPIIDELANTIKHGNKLDTKTSLSGKFLSGPINKSFYAMGIHDKAFKVSSACNGCGLCEKGCVTSSIVMQDGKPTWSGKCTHCMACICNCPKEAIEYGKKSVGKPRYKCPTD